MSTPARPLLRTSGLTRVYRRGTEAVTALAEVSFELDPGELLVLTGPSGSGKTTLLNILAGWEQPDAGEVVWCDPTAAAPTAPPSWDQLAIAPQRLGLLEELTVAENIELPLRLSAIPGRWPDPDRLASVLELFGLSALAHRMPSETSLGEQQRTAIARALVGTPRLLLADEPTGHQDTAWVEGVLDGLRKAAAAGSTVLIATHDEQIIAQAPRRLTLRDGRLVDT